MVSLPNVKLLLAIIWAGISVVSISWADSNKPPSGGTSCAPAAISKLNTMEKLPLILDRSPIGELNYWNEIKHNDDARSVLAYITNFPNGMFVDPAIEKYRSLCGNVTAIPAALLMCAVGSDPIVDKCRSAKHLILLNSALKIPVPGNVNAPSDLKYWNAIKDSGDSDAYLIYITHFPNGLFIDSAVEKYRQNCGDLSKLPAVNLMCQVSLPPPPAPPVIKPPPIKPPRVKLPPVSVPPPPPGYGGCGSTFTVFGNCSGHSGGSQSSPPPPPPPKPRGTRG